MNELRTDSQTRSDLMLEIELELEAWLDSHQQIQLFLTSGRSENY